MQALIIAWNDYFYTGDDRSIAANYELLNSRTQGALRRDNGLISTTADKTVATPEFRRSIKFNGTIRGIVDWPHDSEEDGFVFTDYNCGGNAFHYRARCLLTRIARQTGRTKEARKLDEDCKRLYRLFNDAFFDPATGTYRAGTDTDHHTLHSARFVMAFGLVPEEHRDAVLAYIRSRNMACSVYGTQFLPDAVYDAGESDYAQYLLTKQNLRSRYNMLVHDTTITYEARDDSFKPNQDWNHAWAAAPANILMRKPIDVEPLIPGCELLSVCPQISSLHHVEATLPTIRGSVEVAIENNPGLYRPHVTVPANTTARITQPVAADRFTLTCNGERRRTRRTSRKGFIDAGETGSGNYVFEARF